MTEETLQQAIALARTGQKQPARDLLQAVLNENPANEIAWLWLADCMNTRDERIQVLETCLRFIPGSQAARAGMAALRRQAVQEQFPEPGPTHEQEPAPPPAAGAAIYPMDWEAAGDEGDNEWPNLRDQIKLEPWMQDMADEAGPALGSLLGNPEESEGLPGRARAYDNLPTLPTRHPEPPAAFTVEPDAITEEEFSEVESRTEAELRSKPAIRPLKNQGEDQEELADSLFLSGDENLEIEDDLSSTELLDEEDILQAAEGQDWAALDPQAETGQRDIAADEPAWQDRTAPHKVTTARRRRTAAQKKPRRSQAILYILLVIVGLLGLAAVLFGLLLSM